MGTIADSLFSALMSWVRALVNDLWTMFSSERTTVLEVLGKNWIGIVIVLLAVGLIVDWLVWLVRWQPYHLWAQRVRRLLRIPSEEIEDEDKASRKATAARMPERRTHSAYQRAQQEEESWLPERPVFGEEDEQQAYEQADSVPDEELGAYPGMRYGAASAQMSAEMTDPSSLSAVHSEGPGAAEVARRRAEIDAWQQQLQEEARARAEAEQARLLREAQEAERIRRAREAEEAERARQELLRAQQEEQARQAQAQYALEMAEYERQKAQYERDLAEYERQKAEYDAQMQAWQAQQEAASRRQAAQPAPRPRAETRPASSAASGEKGGLKSRMVRAMQRLEPEETEVNAITAIPSRVDKKDAYAPAKKPKKPGRRRK